MGGKVRKWGLLSIQQQHRYILLAANCNIQTLRRRKPNLGVGPPAMTPLLRHYSMFYQWQKVKKKKGHQMRHGAAILHKLAMTVVIKSAIHHNQYLTTLIVN
jgi:hypothetical protein